ncbi:MAG TPA: hypothetical protein VGM67_19475 [Gemmatimonadaceae bacterium]|jgi:hypothetical protein
MKMNINRSAIAMAIVVSVVGCSDSSSSATGPTLHQLDVATEISAMSNGGVGGTPGVSTLLALPTSTTLPAVVPSACAYSTTTGGFTCPTAAANGLTFDISYYLSDAAGNSQTSPNVNTTASIRVVADTRGTVSLASSVGSVASATLSDHTDMTMSGLQAANRALNGTSVSHYDVTTTGSTSTHALIDATTTAANVILPPEGSTSQWPASGTVTTDATAVTSIGFLPSITTNARAVVTFDGSSTPTVVVTLAGVVRTCKIDLSGRGQPTCS